MTLVELWQLTRDLGYSLVESQRDIYYPAFGITQTEAFVTIMDGEGKELVQYAQQKLGAIDVNELTKELSKYAKR